jgi:ATP-dependent exoDNAse (exonuclease V) alpha subunit
VRNVNQLPPVGPDQFFRDLLESGQIPVIELTKSMRQSGQSAIVASAKQIKAGVVPELVAPGQSKSDCKISGVSEIETGFCSDLFTLRSRFFHFLTIADIQRGGLRL